MNKPRPVREGFVSDDEPPFERNEKDDLSPMERPGKTIEHELREEAPPRSAAKSPTDADREELRKPVTWPFTYKLLYRPLQLAHESIDELTFREPSAGDLFDYGNPVSIEFRQIGKQVVFNVHIDDNKMMALLASMCTHKRVVTIDHLKGMDIRDFANISQKLRHFFRPDWESVTW